MREPHQRTPGFQEDIHPGVWQRHHFRGVPQKLAYAWIALCGCAAAHVIYRLPWKWLVPVLVLWGLGHHGMVLLTRWDPQWDDVLLAGWKVRRYKKRYAAG